MVYNIKRMIKVLGGDQLAAALVWCLRNTFTVAKAELKKSMMMVRA